MKKDLFDRLINSAKQARDHVAGKKELRTTVLPKPSAEMSADEIVALCESRNISQAVFAGYLNISPKTVQAWEQGIGKPGGAALKLLWIAKKNPRAVFTS